MKKLLKKLIALTLSLVMAIGTIPCFTNVVEANDKTIISEITLGSSQSVPTIGGSLTNFTPCIGKTNTFDEKFQKGITYGEGYYLTPECDGEICTHSVFQKDTTYYYKRIIEILNQKDEYELADELSISLVFSDFEFRILKDEIVNEYKHELIMEIVPVKKTFSLSGTETLYSLNMFKMMLGLPEFDYYPISGHRGIYYVVFHFTDELDIYRSIKFKDDEYISNIKTSKPSDEDIFNEKCFIINGASGFDTYFVYDWSKIENITFKKEAGMTVADVLTSITKSSGTLNSSCICPIIDDIPQEMPLENSDILEAGKKYKLCVTFDVPSEGQNYAGVKVNNDDLTYVNDLSLYEDGWYVYGTDSYLDIKYTFECQNQTFGTSSKKYKANDTKDTTEKISGSGKKGSKRTITPIEGKKVSSVVVTDKDGNKIDVTLNEDGTYSFVQPASNVDVQVNYINREITLNIGSTEASVDGETSNLDVAPVIRNDRTMLPIRFVAENLGAKVEWDEKNPNYVVITRGDTKIEITLGSDIMKVNGKDAILDSVAFAENDRTYLPVRAVSEALNAKVEWNETRPNEVKIYEQ